MGTHKSVERGGHLLVVTKKPNPVLLEDGVAYVTTKRRSGEEVVFLVDEPDYWEFVAPHRWHVTSHGYACTNSSQVGSNKQHTVRLHRLLMGFPEKPMQCDHINRNRLDNRRSNLRLVTHKQNGQNVTPQKGGTSKYRGVYWDKTWGKWGAIVQHHRKSHREVFDDELEAHEWCVAKRAELFTHHNEEWAP